MNWKEYLRARGYLPGATYFDGRTYEWTDTPQGWKAAENACGYLNRTRPSNGDAPIQLDHVYTVERLTLESQETYTTGDGRVIPVLFHYRVVVRQWSRRSFDREERLDAEFPYGRDTK